MRLRWVLFAAALSAACDSDNSANHRMGFDHQDPQNLAHFLYGEPISLANHSRASVLATEGLGDTMVPFYAERAGAYALGIPQIQPSAVVVPFLTPIDAPVSANIDSKTTAAFFQYVPSGYTGAMPSPGCVANKETEGHTARKTPPRRSISASSTS